MSRYNPHDPYSLGMFGTGARGDIFKWTMDLGDYGQGRQEFYIECRLLPDIPLERPIAGRGDLCIIEPPDHCDIYGHLTVNKLTVRQDSLYDIAEWVPCARGLVRATGTAYNAERDNWDMYFVYATPIMIFDPNGLTLTLSPKFPEVCRR